MALPLVQFEDDGQCAVCPEGMAFLRTIQDPVTVVAVAGRYRTGKSYLLNHVLLRTSQEVEGFPVGPTTQPCTKGLWIWPHTVHRTTTPDGRPCHVLVIDTEGTGATNSNDTRDTRIFALALLLSSYFIYNSQGSIDEPALANLQVVTQVSEMVRVKAQAVAPWNMDESDSLANFFPTFMWVVRDFVLELRAEDGSLLQEKGYLEEALRCDRGGAAKDEVRKAILEAFPHRDCATLVRPCHDEQKLRHLNHMPESDLRPEFVQQTAALRAKALAAPAKTVQGEIVTGAMLATLCECYTTAIATGGAPVIETAWTYVCADQCRRAAKEAQQCFAREMADAPEAPLELAATLARARTAALAHFCSGAVGDQADETRAELEATLERLSADAEREALARWQSVCARHWIHDGSGEETDTTALVQAWYDAMGEGDEDVSVAMAAYRHGARLRANVDALQRALQQHLAHSRDAVRDAQKERAETLQQLLQVQAEMQALQTDGREKDEAHRREREAWEAQQQQQSDEFRRSLTAMQDELAQERTAAQERATTALDELRETMAAQTTERQERQEALRRENQELRSATSSAEAAVAEKDDACAARDKEIAELKKRLEASALAETHADEARRDLELAQQELQRARRDLQETQRESAEQLSELRATWEERQTQQQQAALKMQEQLQQVERFAEEAQSKDQQRIAELSAAHQRQKDEAAAQKRSAEEERAALEQQLASAKQQVTQVQQQHDVELARLRADHHAELSVFHQQQRKADSAGLCKEMKMRDTLADLQTSHALLEARKDDVDSQLKETRSTLKRKRDEVEQLKSDTTDMEKLRLQLAHAQTVYKSNHTAYVQLQKDHDVALSKIEQLRARSTVEQNKLEIQCGTHAARVRELEASNAHVKVQLAKESQEVKRLRAVFDSIKT